MCNEARAPRNNLEENFILVSLKDLAAIIVLKECVARYSIIILLERELILLVLFKKKLHVIPVIKPVNFRRRRIIHMRRDSS